MTRLHKRKRWMPKGEVRGMYELSNDELGAMLDAFEIDYGSTTDESGFLVQVHGEGMRRGIDVDVYDDLTDVDLAELEEELGMRKVRHRWAHIKVLDLFPQYGKPTWSDYTLYEWLVMDLEGQESEVIEAALAYIKDAGERASEEWMTRKEFHEIRSQW